MSGLEIKREKMKIAKALAAKAEIEFKMAEKLDDIERMKEHLTLQDGVIESANKKLQELGG